MHLARTALSKDRAGSSTQDKEKMLVKFVSPNNSLKLTSVEEYQAGHHAGDTGPGGWAFGAPCSIAGHFGCAPAGSSEEYYRDTGHPDDGHAWLVAHPFY